MRILVVSQYFWPENFRINDLVREWVNRGHQVTVLTGVPNYPAGKVYEDYLADPDAFSFYEGAQVVRVPMLPRCTGHLKLVLNYLSFVVGGVIWGAWRLRGLAADVVFVFQTSPVTVGVPAIFLGKLKRAPVVLWVLDLWPDTLRAMGVVHSPLVLGWVENFVQFIYRHCALVLGQSRGFLDSIGRLCEEKNKIRYLPSWAEDVYVSSDVEPAPDVPSFKNGFTILFAGNIGEAQDMGAVLDAAEYLKSNTAIRWIIVGDGSKSAWLKTEVKNRGLQNAVLVPGRFPLERMPSFYAHADALLLSLKNDPLFNITIPGKLQSYMMAGVPLIGMLDGEGAALIRDAKAGLTCAAGDGAGLANSVLAMAMASPDQRFLWGENGRNYAQQQFSRTELMDRIEGFLEEVNLPQLQDD